MKYKDRDELVAGLREFADFIEEKGLELPLEYPHMKLTQYVYNNYRKLDFKEIEGSDKAKMRRAALTLSRAEKIWGLYYFDLRREFGPVSIVFSIAREKICEKKVVGVKEHPEQIIPAHTEELIAWECLDPILK